MSVQHDKKLQEDLERARAELTMFYEISNAMRTTLKLDEVLFIVLTAVTSHEGLGFNRAMLFLLNEKENTLEGKMGIGPQSGEEANRIWTHITAKKMDLDDFIQAYNQLETQVDAVLNNTVRNIKIPLKDYGGVIAQTALESRTFEITTAEMRSKINDPVLNSLNVEYFISVPLKARDRVVGVILADNHITKKPIDKDDVRILTMFANQAGLAIENSRLYEKTLLMSNMDWLTKLWNHGYFQSFLKEQIEDYKNFTRPFSLAMIDIDNFKNYNDTLGHQAGDTILKEVARILSQKVRQGDVVARYGGEEFALILLGANKNEAYSLCEQIRREVEHYPFPFEDIQPGKNITISIGLSSFPEDCPSSDKDLLIKLADMALLEAKRAGKNKTFLYQKSA